MYKVVGFVIIYGFAAYGFGRWLNDYIEVVKKAEEKEEKSSEK